VLNKARYPDMKEMEACNAPGVGAGEDRSPALGVRRETVPGHSSRGMHQKIDRKLAVLALQITKITMSYASV
jgi:hypothetical protein